MVRVVAVVFAEDRTKIVTWQNNVIVSLEYCNYNYFYSVITRSVYLGTQQPLQKSWCENYSK